jgi:hypothetical protein
MILLLRETFKARNGAFAQRPGQPGFPTLSRLQLNNQAEICQYH